VRYDGTWPGDQQGDLQALPPGRKGADKAIDAIANDLPFLAAHPPFDDFFRRAEAPNLSRREHSVLLRRQLADGAVNS